MKTSVPAKVGKKAIRVISLEGLVLAKLRAGRSQDIADLQQLMANCGNEIRWEMVGEVATELETTELRRIAKAFS